MEKNALEGLKVLDVGAYAAGPGISKYLANFGAQVAHLESAGRPDGFRLQYPPFTDNVPGINRSGCFGLFNDSKMGVTLDLKNPKAAPVVRRVAAWADVVIENMRPGVLAKLGLDYATLNDANPALILLHSCNMGQDGPRATHPGFGSQLSSLSGFTHLTGQAGGPPQILYGPYIDFIGLAYGLVSIMAALDERARSGLGQEIDLSQYETGLHFIAAGLLEQEANGHTVERQGNRDPQAAPHGAFACRDGMWCALSCWSEQDWRTLCETLNKPEWAQDPRFAGLEARKQHEDVLEEAIGGVTAGWDAWELMKTLQGAGLPAGVVNRMEDLFSDPQILSRRGWQSATHPEMGEVRYRQASFEMSETPGSVKSAAPCLGQHNEHFFKELLGYSEAEYLALVDEGVID